MVNGGYILVKSIEVFKSKEAGVVGVINLKDMKQELLNKWR